MGNLDEPAFLSVGTEVSAKYKGAFCEAKIKKISKLVKCKVQYSNGTVSLISDEVVKGTLKVGATVEIKGDKKEVGEVTIQKIQDYSQYTVVFDDGDITCLKRSALCLKSGRHFAASSSLDELPLTHPEHNISLNGTNTARGRRSRKENKSFEVNIKEEVIEMVEFDIGSVLCVETTDKKKIRDNWFPGLIVAPTAQSSIKTNTAKEYLVRSFKDGKYYTVQKKESLKVYTSEIGAKVENPTLKTAVEKTQMYITKDELPPHWDRDLLFGTDKCVTTDSEGAYDSENSDEESIEEKDHFVAQLFKFMDDRGTPLNDLPKLNGRDIDLYKLFKIVNSLGGINKVNKYGQWHVVAFKLGEENMSEEIAKLNFQRHYNLYLQNFEEFHRKLGCTMLSHPRGVRSRSRFSRNIIRDIDKALPSTSSTTDKNKQSSTKQESNEKKDKAETVKENDTFKDPVTIKKVTKSSKSDDKSNKINHESVKKGEKKKDDISSNISRSKSVKWDPEILDSKDSKTKKELKEMLKKESDAKDSDIESNAKKEPKKKNTRNLFGKNARKTPKKEKVVKVKSAETGLPALRKVRSIKEQIKTFVKVITPFSKSKRGVSNTQQESLNKTKLDEDVPKLTRSKSKEEVPNKSRRSSILSDSVVSSATLPSVPSGSVIDNQSKVKKLEDGSEKKKPVRKKKDDKDDKVTSNDLNTTPTSEVETSLKDQPSVISNGDHIIVFYGGDDAITYDAKVLRISMVEGVLKYLVHYKGWNSRYDEWVESSRTALKSKGSTREQDHDETDSLKNEPKIIDPKKTTPTNRARRSATPSLSNSNRKKSPFSSVRPTRTCTLNERLLSSIDNSDSESEDINLEITKQNKKSQPSINSTKSEQEDTIIKTESTEADNQKKIYPKTYPSKEVLMQRNVPRKPKSCMFKVHSDKSEENETSEQVDHKPPFEYNFEMPPPSNVKKTNSSNENEDVQIKSKIDKDSQNEPKIAHYLSPKEKSEKNNQQHQTISETQKSNEEIELNVESSTLPVKPKSTGVIYYPSSLEEEEQRETEQMSSNDDKPDESKISGTDFDLNKIRSEMKGLMPTSTNSSNLDLIHSTESVSEKQVTEIPKSIEPVTEDIYEFTESEPCDFENIPSVIEEKQRRVIKHIDPPKPHNLEHPVELPKVIESITSVETVEQNESMTPFVSDIHDDSYSFDDNTKIENKEKLNIKIENSISHNESDNESNASENLILNDVSTDTSRVSQTKICHVELDETGIKDEVLDLCMKPPESPPSNIFSMPESNETNDMIEDDDDDDDESKLVIAENDKIENEYQIDTNQMMGEENNFSNEQSENVPTSSPPPPPPSIHQLPSTDSEFHSSYQEQRNIPKDIDDESTTSCNESIQNALIQSFQMYSNFENQSTKTKSYQSYLDNNDDSTKSGFEFDSNSKSPTIDNTESVESDVKLSIYEPTNNIKREVDDYENEKIREKPDKLNTSVLPELQCREEIVDEDTLNNALVIEYNRKNIDYDIHKPSTSKGFFDSINHPSTSKDGFYETDPERDTKNSFFESRQANLVKSVIFDSNSPSASQSGLFDETTVGSNTKDNFYDNPSSSKNSRFYETSMPCSSKSFYNPDPDVNNVLFCEETIPGSPTGISEDHYDHEERKRVVSQAIYEGREAREAASTMFALKESYHRPMITLMGASEKELEEYTNMLQNDGGLLDQRHLQFLAEISSRNLSININEPSVTESSSEGTTKSQEKSHTKRKNSNHEHSTTKRNKTPSTAVTPETNVEKPVDIKVPLKDGKPLIVFTPEMDSAQRQTLLLNRMNDLRKEYILVKSRISVIDRRRKKIRKRKRELAKAATIAQNKQNLVACSAK